MTLSDNLKHIGYKMLIAREWYDIIKEIQDIKTSLEHLNKRLQRPQDLDPSDIIEFRKEVPELIDKLEKLKQEEKKKIEEIAL